jgi:hypothetical protein
MSAVSEDDEQLVEFAIQMRMRRVFVLRIWLGHKFLRLAIWLMGARTVNP